MDKDSGFDKLMGALDEINNMMSIEVRERALDSATNLISKFNQLLDFAQSLEGNEREIKISEIKDTLLTILIDTNAFSKMIPKEHNEVLKEEMWKILKTN